MTRAIVLADREVRVETPEHVAIGYTLADLGSRFTALLLDGLILGAAFAVLFIGIPLLVRRLGGLPDAATGWGLAVMILLGFGLAWGYFVFFEGLRDGQTPGKRAVGIRVVHEGGYPLTVRGAAVRNLLRLVDVQPVPSWLVGGVTMLLHPRTQRLGDLAAGTVVVRERVATTLPEAAPAREAAGPPRLHPEQLAVLGGYVARRTGLAPEVRARIAGQLAEGVRGQIADDPRRSRMSPDAYLVLLHAEEHARHAASGGAGAAGSARAAALVRSRRAAWDEYRALLAQAQRRGLVALPETEVSRFAALYRGLAADLARARSYRASGDLLYALERWVAAGHNLLYRPAQRSWRLLGRWLAAGFPALVRRRWRPILFASAVFYLPALVAYAAIRLDPPRARELLPAAVIARAEEAPQRTAQGKGYVEVPELFMPAMATGIIANNVQVTFGAFAGGVLAGVGTVLVLVFNGVFLGAVAALFANHGSALQLWTFVLPHGITELTAICIAGGAGVWLGSAIVLPGRRTRGEVLVERGREAVALLGGTVFLLVIAGIIEGFVSPSTLPGAVKFAVAAAVALLLFAYLLLAGREEDALGVARHDATAARGV